MVVVTRSIFDNWSNPYCSETEGFNIIEFFDKAFEISTPSRVAFICCLVVPALSVVRRVTIVETSSHDKIDGFVAEISSITNKS